MSPIAELRGGIPLGLALGLPLETVLITAILFNCLIFFPVYFGLDLLYERFFSRYRWARNLMENMRKKGKAYVDKYEMIGLAIFVGIPLPLTGAWTGTGIAWVLGLDWKKSFLSVSAGVVIAACIVTAAYFLLLTLVNAFSLGVFLLSLCLLAYVVYLKSMKEKWLFFR
jgi:uncharacterized membrane protein